MRFDKLPVRPKIEYDGQRYVDEPVYKTIKPIASTIAVSVRHAFGHRVPTPIEILEGYVHTKLRWMKPDGSGGLVPR